MKRKQKSKIICKNLMRKFDYLSNQEDVLVSVVMDSLKEIKKIEEDELYQQAYMKPPQFINVKPVSQVDINKGKYKIDVK